MPTATNDGVELFYDVDGEGTSDQREPVVFVGDAGYGAWQWGVQQPAIAGPRRTVVWDLRGTGRSDAPPGPYAVEDLAGDLEAVLAAADVARAHLVGGGLGGMIALRYAREYGRARSLALFGTAPSGDAVDADALRALHPEDRSPEALRESLAGAFSPAFRREQGDVVDRIVEWRGAEDAPPAAVEAQLAAVRDFEAGPLYEVGLPALVGHGEDDPAVPPAAGEALADDLPRGEYVPIAGRHLAVFEAGGAVTDRLVAFMERAEAGPSDG